MAHAVEAVGRELVEEGLREHRQQRQHQHMQLQPPGVPAQVAEALRQQEAVEGEGEAPQQPQQMIAFIVHQPQLIEQDPQMIRQHA